MIANLCTKCPSVCLRGNTECLRCLGVPWETNGCCVIVESGRNIGRYCGYFAAHAGNKCRMHAGNKKRGNHIDVTISESEEDTDLDGFIASNEEILFTTKRKRMIHLDDKEEEVQEDEDEVPKISWKCEKEAHEYMYLLLRKRFNRKTFRGQVVGYLESENNDGVELFHIRYEDNDEEDMEKSEVNKIIKLKKGMVITLSFFFIVAREVFERSSDEKGENGGTRRGDGICRQTVVDYK